jgi:predicted PurR-regulated permease PerM
VRALSRFVQRGLAILATALVLLGLVALGLVFLVPLLIEQLGDLTSSLPRIASSLDSDLRGLLESLEDSGNLPVTADEVLATIGQDLFGRVEALARQLLASITGFVSSVFNFGVVLFGTVFVAIYLLVDAREIKAAYLRAAPRRYRRDAGELWWALDVSLSRYLGGLALILVAQGALSGLALWILGVP